MNRPMIVQMLRMSSASSGALSLARSAVLTAEMNVKNRARAVTAAEAMAKPLATAAVVLPSESSSSVAARTSGSRWAISAMPPALSAIGP